MWGQFSSSSSHVSLCLWASTAWLLWLILPWNQINYCKAFVYQSHNHNHNHQHGWIQGSRAQSLGFASSTPRKGSRRKSRKRSPSTSNNGFGTATTEEERDAPTAKESPAQVKTTATQESKPIYSMPSLYDLAFGYRNYEEEVDFLIGQHMLQNEGTPPRRTLELAAGPARHSIFALLTNYVQQATAIDNSPKMVEYGTTIAMEELAEDIEEGLENKQDSFTYWETNMENFQLPEGSEKYDSAWILLGSLQHLTENAQVVNCFQSIYSALNPGGTLILELPHPRETFSMAECTKNGWEVPIEDDSGEESGELQVIWGDDNDEFNPVTQVRQFTVGMELKGNFTTTTDSDFNSQTTQSVRETVPMRLFTTQEISALAQIAGFELKSLHGALADDVDINGEEEAFRLVCVLQKQ